MHADFIGIVMRPP